ncbi:S1 family peptidase [Rubrobacter tropicus]|uniref:S1 family peptidase n=1 Tax=Rubrobacter tropicus TaxID=2653851 RepID=UPI001D18DA39|nr:serine protease [Rubrobacter tropicus]
MVESGAVGDRQLFGRYFLAVVLALAIGLGVSVPAFAAEGEPEIQPHIVGGTAVPDGKYRFIAALRDVTNGSTVYQQQFCGATLIDSDSVLTAAHCLEGTTAAPLRVTVGITDLSKQQGQTRSVAAIFRHPNYTSSTVSYRYDAAVLKLSSPVTGISPVKIPATTYNTFETPGRRATIAGWGNTVKQPPSGGAGSNYPYRMREAKVPIVRDGVAKDIYGSAYATGLMVAAGREGKDTCQGDSGGPMFVSTSSGRYQIGITSFGAGCGAQGFPGVYAEANSGPIRSFIYNAASR